MNHLILELLGIPDWPGMLVAVQLAVWVPVVYLAVYAVRALSPSRRWKLLKAALIVLFLPIVLIWKVGTAGSDCGCCCDEDD